MSENKNNSWIGAIVNAAVQTGSAVYDSIQQKQSLQDQTRINLLNHAFAKEQNEWNKSLIDDMNKYNSPQNQRNLLEEAGYNPAMYSPDGMSQGTILASAPLANQQPRDFTVGLQGINQSLSSIANSGYSYLESKRIESETERIASDTSRIKEDTKKIIADTHLSEENAQLVAIDIDKTNEEILNLRETRQSILQSVVESKSRTDFNYSNISKILNDLDISRKQYQLAARTVEANITKIFSDLKVNDEKIKEIRQNIILLGRDAVLKGKLIRFQDINNIYREIEKDYLSQEKESELNKIRADIYRSLTGEVNRTVNTFIGDILSPLHNKLFGPSLTSGQHQKFMIDNIFNNHNYFNKQY